MSTKSRATTALGLSAALLLVTPVAAVADPCKKPGTPPAPQQQTLANLSAAMHGEAFAHAAYLEYGTVAATPRGPSSLEKLFQRTAGVELDDHFALEASLSGLVGTTDQNLQTAINGENYETTTMYVEFAQQAYEDGDDEVGDLFTDIAGDEALHRDAYAGALASLSQHPAGQKNVPEGQTPAVVPVLTGGGTGLSDRTKANLSTAMHGEAFAYASYMLYADQAQRSGMPKIAQLFRATAQVELTEHFREEGNLLGLAGDNATNLQTAIAGETYEWTQMYPQYASEAAAVGDTTVADAFREIAGDEKGHAAAFQAALDALG